MLRLEGGPVDGPNPMNSFVGDVLGAAWSRGRFAQLREFTLYMSKAHETGVIKPLTEAWKTAEAEHTANLEVAKYVS